VVEGTVCTHVLDQFRELLLLRLLAADSFSSNVSDLHRLSETDKRVVSHLHSGQFLQQGVFLY